MLPSSPIQTLPRKLDDSRGATVRSRLSGTMRPAMTRPTRLPHEVRSGEDARRSAAVAAFSMESYPHASVAAESARAPSCEVIACATEPGWEDPRWGLERQSSHVTISQPGRPIE